MRGKIIIIQGGQWGSEGKGQVAAELAWREGASCAVRTGSINAGHTVHTKDNRKFVMQIIPTPWVIPGIKLVIGAGCYIEPDVLANEVAQILEATGEDIRDRLFIDHRCAWFGHLEHDRAKQANRHHAMGATGKGCSEAIVSKMQDRGSEQPHKRLFKNRPLPYGAVKYQFVDTVQLLDEVLESGQSILLEGTQGAMLDFNTGPYPYVTSRMTNAAAWLAEAGLPPVNVETALVVRSHPIRVAGNSGPMPGEISWPELARNLNRRSADAGGPEIVPEYAIRAFEAALLLTLQTLFPEVMADTTIPPEDKIDFHLWTPQQRVVHRVAVSEANAAALKKIDALTLKDLSFFERTTVTKKLRRIAQLDFDVLREAIRMNRPAYMVYTFLNYDFPQITNSTDVSDLTHPVIGAHLDRIFAETGVPIRYVTTGPLPEHQILNTTTHGK